MPGSSTPARPASSSTGATWKTLTSRCRMPAPTTRTTRARKRLPRSDCWPQTRASSPPSHCARTLLWGPHDTQLTKSILARGRAGTLTRIGGATRWLTSPTSKTPLWRICWQPINCAPRSPSISGRPFFISQGEPVPLWSFIDRLLAAGSLPPVRRIDFASPGVCRRHADGDSPTIICRSRASRGSRVFWPRNSAPPTGLTSTLRAGTWTTRRSSPSKKAFAALRASLARLKQVSSSSGLIQGLAFASRSSGRAERNPIEAPHVSGRRHGSASRRPFLKNIMARRFNAGSLGPGRCSSLRFSTFRSSSSSSFPSTARGSTFAGRDSP